MQSANTSFLFLNAVATYVGVINSNILSMPQALLCIEKYMAVIVYITLIDVRKSNIKSFHIAHSVIIATCSLSVSSAVITNHCTIDVCTYKHTRTMYICTCMYVCALHSLYNYAPGLRQFNALVHGHIRAYQLSYVHTYIHTRGMMLT